MNKLFKIVHLPYLPILLVAMGLFGPMIIAGRAMFWGTPALQFVPWWHWAWQTLSAGQLPLWNPLVGMGAPLIANYQSALFYPPYWFYYLLDMLGGAPALAWGQALLVALHLVWAGTGMAFLARRLGLGTLGQAIGGLAFGFSGYLVSRAGFLSINSAVAWLPWIILCATPGPGTSKMSLRRFLALVACLTLQLLVGHAQTAWYTLLLAVMWSGFWAWQTKPQEDGTNASDRSKWNFRLTNVAQAWIGLGLALALAVGLAAIQLLPTGEYLAQSQRSEAVDFEFAMTYSFWPWRLLGLLAPDMFGSPVQGDYWGYANYWEDALYIGLLPFLLALGALWQMLRRKRQEPNDGGIEAAPPALATNPRLPWFLLVLFLMALVLGMGKNTPVFPWLYYNVPSFDLFNAPTRIMIWAVFALSLLAGLGCEDWRRPEGRALYWTRLGTMGAFAVSLGAGLAWYFMGDISPSFIRATAILGMWGVGAGLLSLTAPPRLGGGSKALGGEIWKYNTPWQWAVALFVAVDLFIAGWGLNPSVELDLYRTSPIVEDAKILADGQRMYLSASDEYVTKFERFLRFDTFEPNESWSNLHSVILPNMNMLDDFPSANNFDPLVPGRYARWMEYLDETDDRQQADLLDLMGVGLVEKVDHDEPYAAVFYQAKTDGRLRWVPCAHFVQDENTAWDMVTRGEIEYRKEVVVEGDDPTLGPACDPMVGELPEPSILVDIKILANTPGLLSISMRSPAPGWLVISDVWYPGWTAQVRESAAPILRANYLFRALPVSAGDQEITIRYRPVSFWLGALLSLLAWPVLIGVWWFGRKVNNNRVAE